MKSQPAWIATFTLILFALFAALPAAAQARSGSLLPDEPHSGISGTLSSWDTSPTGVYKESGNALGSPFPMAANPALKTGSSLLPAQEEVPASMSTNLSRSENGYELGSPFPMAADPAIREGHNKLESVDEGSDFSRGSVFADTASPFPTAGAPARRNAW